MSNALMIIGSEEFSLMEKQAKIIVESGLLPKSVNTWQKAVVIMMQGRELGIGAMASLRGIDVIQGTPSVKPQLMLALIERTGQLEDMVIHDDGQKCAVTMTRKGRSAHTETFSMEDAKRMKTKEDGQTITLAEKFNWRSMPEVMRKWRAIAACARVVFPDVVLGLYTQDEMGEGVVYDDSGEIIEGTIEEPPPPFVPEPIHAPAPKSSPESAESGHVPENTPARPTLDSVYGPIDSDYGPDDPVLGDEPAEDAHDPAYESGKATDADPMDDKPVQGNTTYCMDWVMLNNDDLDNTKHAYNAIKEALGWETWKDAGIMPIGVFKQSFTNYRQRKAEKAAAKK